MLTEVWFELIKFRVSALFEHCDICCAGVLSQQVQQALVLVSARLKAATEWRARCRDVLANTPVHRVTLSELDVLISEAHTLQAWPFFSFSLGVIDRVLRIIVRFFASLMFCQPLFEVVV